MRKLQNAVLKSLSPRNSAVQNWQSWSNIERWVPAVDRRVSETVAAERVDMADQAVQIEYAWT
jgi:hypothetical protein